MDTNWNSMYDTLSEPVDYFTGLGATPPWIPTNILIFSRKSFQELQPRKNSNFHYRFSLSINLGDVQHIIVDHQTHEIGRDMSLLVFPHQYHRFIETNGDVRMIFITFEAPSNPFVANLRNQVIRLDADIRQLIKQVCTNYTQTVTKTDEENLQLHLGLLLHMMIREKPLLPHRPEAIGSLVPANILKACEIICKDPRISITELSTECSISEGYLRFQFKHHIGISLGQYCMDITIHKAKQLLANTTLSIGQVGEYCGYESLYSFSRMFSRETGLSPKKFRLSIKQST